MKHTIALFALLLSTVQALAARAPDEGVPSRVEVKYRVSVAGLPVGQGVDVFQHDGKTYSIVSESTVALVLTVRREAKGSVTAGGLRPLSYVETRNGRFKRSANFDWAAGQVQLTEGDQTQTVPLPPNTWDAASLAWNFAFSRSDGKDLQVHMTDGRRVTHYTYTILGREKITTPLGELETMHVKKVQENGDKRAFEVWLAIDRHLLPARVLATEKDGTAFDSMVESVNLAP
ncbi:MAG TPA: DUF3108 domain-containing protein [Burkholderiales bacterium]|nr:DUF3108 domain-containing protein [Burkholderiales bacterium]